MKILEQVNKLLPYFKKPSGTDSFQNILVVSNTGLGDTLLSTPSIVSLRKSFPSVNLTFLINKKMFPLFDGFEFIDDFVLYSSGFFNQLKIIKELRSREIDTIFLFHSNGPEDIFFSVLSGAKNILKMTDDKNHKFREIFLNAPNTEQKHNIEKKLDLVKVFNPNDISKKMLIPARFYNKNGFIKKNPHFKYIGFQMGAQDDYKMWPKENFIKLAQRLKANFHNIKFVLIGATKTEDLISKNFETTIINQESVINLCGKSKINELPVLIKDLDLLLTNDTGAMHLAIALQTKTVSLFGPTDSKTYGPYQDYNMHKVIQADGDFVNIVPKKQRGSEGMALITVDQVFEKTKEFLSV
jgi:ADP-heptose:LPS heptosyltransferase